MGKELRCSDLMAGCDFVAKGKDEGEVLKAAATHAKSAHGINEITPDLEKKVRGAIRDDRA
jgi:predicted small metal-binding protein